MACDITAGRLEPCKDSVGGITAIYIGGAYTPNLLTTATISADGEVSAFAAALTFYKYDLKGANGFEQTNENSRENGTSFWSQAGTENVSSKGAAGFENRGTQWYGGGSLSFGGIPIFVARGMSDNTMIAAETSNLFFGCGLLSDYNECRTIDQTPIDGSQNVRIVMRFTAAVQIGVGANVVYYAG